jgi:arsenate reductase
MTKNILFLCTGNSCRSIMAEALMNHLGQGRYRAHSAGSRPTGTVHPRALETLARHQIPAGTPQSRSWDDFTDISFDDVVTVCDAAATESCPIFPGKARKHHWSTPDPAHAVGSDAEIEAAFDQAFLMLKERIEKLLAED